MKEKTLTSNGSSQANVVNKCNGVLKLGLDMHYRQVTVAMQEDGGRIKAAGKMRHADFLNLISLLLAAKRRYRTAQEPVGFAKGANR